MWFVWLGNLLVSLISYLITKSSFSKIKTLVIIPVAIVYIGMMVTSFSLFVYAVIYIVNNIFDLLNVINNSSSSNNSYVFKCFFYFLTASGILDSLKVGISLIVSNVLAIITLRATMAGKNTVKQIINLFRSM